MNSPTMQDRLHDVCDRMPMIIDTLRHNQHSESYKKGLSYQLAYLECLVKSAQSALEVSKHDNT